MMVSEGPQSPNTPLSETRNHTVKTVKIKTGLSIMQVHACPIY